MDVAGGGRESDERPMQEAATHRPGETPCGRRVARLSNGDRGRSSTRVRQRFVDAIAHPQCQRHGFRPSSPNPMMRRAIAERELEGLAEMGPIQQQG